MNRDDDDWEGPDPLRGKRGWTCRDYVNIGVAIILGVTAFGLLMPAVTKVRDTDSRLRLINTQREGEMNDARPDVGETR